MASFATPANVQAYFRDLTIDATDGAVTSAKIQAWLDSKHQYVMGKIYTLYASTITQGANPLSFLIIADIEAMLVVAIVDDILNNYNDAQKKPTWEKRAMALLCEYIPNKNSDGIQIEPSIKLPDATYLGSTKPRGTLKVSSTATPIFTKGGVNW